MAHTITIHGSGQHFLCAAGTSVLQGMLVHGSQGIPVGCRGGGCGVCKVRVLRGEYRTGLTSAQCVSANERSAGMALACKLFPESDLELDVVGKLANALLRQSAAPGFHFYAGLADGSSCNHSEG